MISSYAKYNTRAGDIFFFYRPKARSGKVESIEYDREEDLKRELIETIQDSEETLSFISKVITSNRRNINNIFTQKYSSSIS